MADWYCIAVPDAGMTAAQGGDTAQESAGQQGEPDELDEFAKPVGDYCQVDGHAKIMAFGYDILPGIGKCLTWK